MNINPFAKHLAQLTCALGLAFGIQSAHAATDWQINPEGLGAGGATTVSAANVGGVGFVQVVPSPTNPGAFTFIEHGAYQLLQTGSTNPFGTRDITVTYEVSGSGNWFNPAALHFSSGSIKLFSDINFDFGSANGTYGADNGKAIGSFSVFDGGLLNGGLVNVQAQLDAGSLLPGYLFDADGNDMTKAGKVLLQLGIYNQTTNPDALLVSEIICGMAGYGGAGCDGTAFINSPQAYAVSDGGSVTLSAVPEPASIALLGIALGAIPVSTRRRSKKAA